MVPNSPLLLLGGTDPVGRFIIERASQQRPVIVIGRSKPHRDDLLWQQADLALGAVALPDGPAQQAIATLPIWLLAAHLPTLARIGVDRLIAFSSTSIEAKRESRGTKAQAVVAALSSGEAAVMQSAITSGIDI